MKMAIAEARKGIAMGHGGPFGAVVVKEGKVIAKGHNHVVANNDPTCHGEIDAIRKACKKLHSFDLSGCEIYTTGYPCPMCFCAILWANIEKVYYGCNTTDTEIIGFRDKAFEDGIPAKKVSMCQEVNRQECLELYREYDKIQNKTNY
ncbi:MAG: nucleoside deaminase [Clostridia bacterium]|nr:nucleoside deaminase [Clostridia bacterium]